MAPVLVARAPKPVCSSVVVPARNRQKIPRELAVEPVSVVVAEVLRAAADLAPQTVNPAKMARPLSPRRVGVRPAVTYFKPAGVPLRTLSEVSLTHDEVEALRLKNLENLSQTAAAKKMGISQSTFQRILTRSYQKTSRALLKGEAIRIEGGAVKFKN